MVKIPRRLDEILPTATMEKLLDVLQQPDISGKVREALHKVGLHDAAPLEKVREAWHQARGWIDSLSESGNSAVSLPRSLNASGQLFLPSLAAIPWGQEAAIEFLKGATTYQSAASIDRQADEVLRTRFGRYLSGHARATAWISSTGQALQLLVNSPAGASGSVVSRVDTVRIHGLGDIRSALACGRTPLIEIGASNGVSSEDWKRAFSSTIGMVILVSPNNLSRQDALQHRAAAIDAARAHGAKVIEVLADGTLSLKLHDHYGFPSVEQVLDSGIDAVILPTQFLLGGPPGALLMGDAELVNAARSHAEDIGAVLDKALVQGAAAAIRTSDLAEAEMATAASFLLANPENLRNRARRLALQLTAMGEIAEAQEVELVAPLGPSPWNRYAVTTWGVRLKPQTSLQELSKQIARGEARQGLKLEYCQETESMTINLRFIPPQHDHEIVLVSAGEASEIPPAPPS